MHKVIIALSIVLVGLIIWQIFAKKGTVAHALRGAGIVASSSTLVALIVALACKIGIVWTPFLVVHIVIGILFFVLLFTTCVIGLMAYFGKPVPLRWHRRFAWATCIFLALALATAFAAAAYRRSHQQRSFPTPASPSRGLFSWGDSLRKRNMV